MSSTEVLQLLLAKVRADLSKLSLHPVLPLYIDISQNQFTPPLPLYMGPNGLYRIQKGRSRGQKNQVTVQILHQLRYLAA